MQPLKKSAIMLLMVFSLMLLIILQLLWLRSSWREARENFRKETNILFRNTIFSMHDSLITQNIQPVRGDTLPRPRGFFLGDSVKFLNPGDTAGHAGSDRSAVVEVFITQTDSIPVHNFLRPLARRMRIDRNNRKFLVRMVPDSLRLDSITMRYAEALSASALTVPFTVHRIQRETPGRLQPVQFPNDVLVSEIVPFNPLTYYVVYFPSANELLMKAIAPQILFSLFVTLLTIGSFYLMYRSMRSQMRLMELKSDFISNMSHELKTPVSTVSVALEALEKFKALDDPQRTGEYLNMAKNELNRLTLMTDKILQTALFENGQPRMNLEVLDIDSAIRDVLGSLNLLIERRKIRLHYETSGDDFRMKGSPSHLTTVVYNLLDNAIKYGGDSAIINVLLEEKASDLILSVSDNGPGIPAHYQRKVFEKFFRVPSGDIHNIKGYGLGLSYVSKVIDHHGGTIEIDSEVGRGTCFVLRLPRRLSV